MNLQVTNNCRKSYWQDPKRITQKIISKIPGKFLDGLAEVLICDDTSDPIIKYTKPGKKTNQAKIEIFMGGFSKGKSYSVLHFNLVFLGAINDHIILSLKPKSTDPDILAVKPSRFNPGWMYLGWSTPILIPLNMIRFVYMKSAALRGWFKRTQDKLLKEIPKNT